MDEMTQLRELRADAPVPDRATLAPGRKRLTDAIEGRSRRTLRLRADWRFASLGAVVAITAPALFVTQIVDTSGPRQSGPATVAGDLDLSSPAAALGEAADCLERQEVPPEPRNDQWIYLREENPDQEKQWKEVPAEVPGGRDAVVLQPGLLDPVRRQGRGERRVRHGLPDRPRVLTHRRRPAGGPGGAPRGTAEGLPHRGRVQRTPGGQGRPQLPRPDRTSHTKPGRGPGVRHRGADTEPTAVPNHRQTSGSKTKWSGMSAEPPMPTVRHVEDRGLKRAWPQVVLTQWLQVVLSP